MNPKLLRNKFFALFFAGFLALSSTSQAQPPKADEVKKLPPVNWIRSRTIDVKHVDIDLRFDWDKESAMGTTAVTLAPFTDTDKIALDAAEMQINSVALNGAPLKFNYKGGNSDNNLEIMLPRKYKRGEDLTVKIDYRTNYVNQAAKEDGITGFGRGLRFIKPTEDEPNKPRQIWSQGETEFNRYWFPSYDSPNDFRTSELKATVQKPFMVVSNGRLVNVKENSDNTRTFHWKMDVPYSNYLTSIVVGEYGEVKGEYAGIPIVSYGYKNELKEVAATVKNLPDMVKFFSEKTGVKYPYNKYAQTMVEEFGGAMENITATTMYEQFIRDERELLDNDDDGIQAHELAHQWFGDYVTTRDWGQIWLNESFATYFDALYQEHKRGHEDFLYNEVRGNQNQYYATWNQGIRRPIVTKNFADKDAMFDTYAYPRGGAVLHMLRKHLGDENWWKAINHYLVSNAHQPVSTEDFRIAIEEATGQSMDKFFDQWLYKMGHPIFEVTKNYDEAKKQLTLNVKQTQKIDPKNEYPQAEFFQTFVDVEIVTPQGARIERVWIEPKAENVFTFNADAKPLIVNFDYEGTLIKELKFEKPVDELVYQMLNDKDLLGRRWAMSELTGIAKAQNTSAAEKQKIMSALVSSAEKDAYWRNRGGAISELRSILVPQQAPGSQPVAVKLDEEVVQMLTKTAKDKQSILRTSAIELLGNVQDPRFADLFFSSLGDQSYAVIGASALALARTKDARAYDALAKLLTAPSWKGRVPSASLNALAVLGDKRAFETAYKMASDKTLPRNVRTSALTVVGATGKGDSRAFPLVFDAFKKALETNNFQGIFSGAQAIITLADPRGQEAFDLLKAKFKDQANLMGFVNMLEQQFKKAVEQK